MTWWAAGAAIAGPLISGVMGADSASEGIAAQTEAARLSDATQRYMYDTTRADNASFLRNGTNSSNRLAYLMGLGGGSTKSAMTADQFRTQLLPQYTRQIAAVPGTAATATQHPGRGADEFEQWIYSGGSNGAPASSQIDESGLNAAIQARLAEQQTQQQQAETAAGGDPAYGSLLRKFSRDDLAGDVVYQNGLQFGLDEGRKGIERQQQASGSLLSGATLMRLSKFGNDYGTTKTEGAYNRYTQDNTNTYNKLAGLAGSGQTAAAQVGSAGQNYANSVSQTAQGLGNARAASGIAGSNAISGGIQGAYNNYSSGELLKTIQRPQYQTPNYGGGYQTGAGTMADLSSYGVF